VTASIIVGSFWLTLGAACSLVALMPADDGFPPAVSSSGTSVDAELQFDKTIVNVAYYYLPLLLMLTDVQILTCPLDDRQLRMCADVVVPGSPASPTSPGHHHLVATHVM
jgi:hypothetical protein